MKVNFFHKLRHSKYHLAFSGGLDSSVLLHKCIKSNVYVELLVIDHLNEFSQIEIEFAKKTIANYQTQGINIPLSVYKINERKDRCSTEFYWSEERDKIYQSLDANVLTGHHLNDVVEWYVMSSMQGQSKLMGYQRGNVLRPFLITPKVKLLEYATYHKLEYLTDPSNQDNNFNLRNKVRNILIPQIQEVFPGIERTVRRLILKKETN